MTCAEIQADLSLYLYGELDFAGEEAVELHLTDCPFCQMALNREKEWHAAVNRRQQDISPEWLQACRENLFQQIASEPTTAGHARHKIAGWWSSLFDIRLTRRSYRLAAVSFLLVVGFTAGSLYSSSSFQPGKRSLFGTAGLIQPAITRVQQIRPESDNRVSIILQQIQERQVSGSRDDDGVRALLVTAAQQSLDPGIRIDSVEMLAGQNSTEIRDALLNAIKNDVNAAVRAKAIGSLRKFPADAAIRGALEYSLANDSDPGVRAEAMEVLVPAQGDLPVTPQLMEIMSNLMHSPQADDYLRLRCAQVLRHEVLRHEVWKHQSLANDTF